MKVIVLFHNGEKLEYEDVESLMYRDAEPHKGLFTYPPSKGKALLINIDAVAGVVVEAEG